MLGWEPAACNGWNWFLVSGLAASLSTRTRVRTLIGASSCMGASRCMGASGCIGASRGMGASSGTVVSRHMGATRMGAEGRKGGGRGPSVCKAGREATDCGAVFRTLSYRGCKCCVWCEPTERKRTCPGAETQRKGFPVGAGRWNARRMVECACQPGA